LWRDPGTVHEHTAYLDFILLHAYYLQQSGQIPASCKWYEQGLNYRRQHSLNNYEAEEFIYKPLGNNYVRLGDYDKAIALQETAVEEAEKHQKKELFSSLYSNLAITYLWLQQYDSVLAICNKGLYFISSNHTVTGLLYNIKTEAFLEKGIKDSAAIYNQRALQFFQSPEGAGADAGWAASTLELTAKILAAEKKYSEALQKITNAENILNQSYPNSRQRDKAKLCIKKGNLLLKLNKVESSLGDFKNGISYFAAAGNYFPDHTVSELYNGMAQCFEILQNDSSLYYYQLSAENDYYASQLITSSFNSVSSLAADKAMQQKAIAAFETKYRQTGNAKYLQQLFWIVELGKGRKLLNEVQRSAGWKQENFFGPTSQLFNEIRYDYLLLAEASDEVRKKEIENRIRKKELELGLEENRFSRLLQLPSYKLFLETIARVTKNATAVSYADAGDSLIVLTASKNNFQYEKILSGENIVSSFVQTYFSANGNAFDNDPAAYFTAAAALYKQLLNKAANQKIIISAAAYLHMLPFEALVIKGQQFLAQEKELSYVYSFLQYNTIQDKAKQPLQVRVYTFEKGHAGFAALPQSKTEASFLQKKFTANAADAASTSTNDLLQQMQQPSILHFATHAVADNGLNQPYLVLKQKFYLGQMQYTATASPLIVLTACETAAGSLQNNEGVMSIGRAFISKGVKGVVASRWKVDDAVAPQLVKTFYEVLNKVHSPAAALFEARKNYLSAANLPQKNPLLWAGFEYMGVEQEVFIKTNHSFNWYWLLMILLAIAFFIFINNQRKKTRSTG
jgi:CHAT domain-containing protein